MSVIKKLIKSFVASVFPRIYFDLILIVVLFVLYLTRFYEILPNPLQLVSFKVLLVSMGFLHAHITRKVCFHKVDWDDPTFTARKVLVIVLYAIFIWAYAQGG